jgi:AcrR family transcriptional regulator
VLQTASHGSGGKHQRDGAATRGRILDAAERLFAEQGVDGTSLRQIMSVAEVSISQINYHFGDKEALLRAIFERKIVRSNRERLAMLEELERSTPSPSIEQILRAYFQPVHQFGPDGRPDDFIRLLGRIGSDNSRMARHIIAEFLDPIHHRFLAALRPALPHVSEEDLFWRLHILLCVMVQTAVNPDRIIHLSAGLCNPRDRDSTLAHLLPALAAALCAQASQGRPQSAGSGPLVKNSVPDRRARAQKRVR